MGAGPRDRKTTIKERQNPTHPLPPLNSNVQWSFSSVNKAIDLYWDNPALLSNNTRFSILGVNVYRSFDSEFGPYHRLNDNPLGSLFYRDEITSGTVDQEDVSAAFLGMPDEANRWIFRTQNYPITRPGIPESVAVHPNDVKVWIDGTLVKVARVRGEIGEIELQSAFQYDTSLNTKIAPILPKPDSQVLCSYEYNTNLIEHDLYKRTFYRVTTVGYDTWDGELKETPLEWASARHIHQMENLDYIWREAIRRNRWILDQGGERVKVFVHKMRGITCECKDEVSNPHPYNACPLCYGTGIRGGYEGPFEILLAPPDVERSIRQTERGRHEEQTYDVWTGPSPLLSQRDFLVKLNGDRYSIGAVRMPTNRGNVLQQHFNVSLLDKQDIRYQVPVTGTDALAFPETRPMHWDDAEVAVRFPQITEKARVADDIEERGRTAVWENITYGAAAKEVQCPIQSAAGGPKIVQDPAHDD